MHKVHPGAHWINSKNVKWTIMPNTFHSLGLQGTLRPQINPSLNIVIPRQRCEGFEERRFFLMEDMCRMKHGFNWIIVEDV